MCPPASWHSAKKTSPCGIVCLSQASFFRAAPQTAPCPGKRVAAAHDLGSALTTAPNTHYNAAECPGDGHVRPLARRERVSSQRGDDANGQPLRSLPLTLISKEIRVKSLPRLARQPPEQENPCVVGHVCFIGILWAQTKPIHLQLYILLVFSPS